MDIYAKLLTPNDEQITTVQLAIPKVQEKSYLQQAYEIAEPYIFKAEVHETEAPIAFTYSLYYVYYDQYTYIRGVLY